MLPAKFFWLGSGFAFFATVLAAIDSANALAMAGWITTIGLAALGVYTRAREIKRDQDVRDKEARRGDCEDQLRGVIAALTDLRHENDQLKILVDKWKELADSLRGDRDNSPKPKEPPSKS